jgi:hypothetical protein
MKRLSERARTHTGNCKGNGEARLAEEAKHTDHSRATLLGVWNVSTDATDDDLDGMADGMLPYWRTVYPTTILTMPMS